MRERRRSFRRVDAGESRRSTCQLRQRQPALQRSDGLPDADATSRIDNSDNIVFSASDGAITLTPGSNVVVDLDGDGVPLWADECPGPGWRAPCDADPSDDGIYDTAYYNSDNQNTLAADVSISGAINFADAYILMDSTGSMGGEQAQLVTDLTSSTFGSCSGAAGTGLIGAMKCSIADLWMGVGEFKEIPLSPHANPYSQTPFHHYLDMTDDVGDILEAVASLVTRSNSDRPEATTQALYSVVTGKGLGPYVPNRASCPAGRWGYPCFRPGSLPIIILFTDAPMRNGPLPASVTYGNPPFDGILGAGALLAAGRAASEHALRDGCLHGARPRRFEREVGDRHGDECQVR